MSCKRFEGRIALYVEGDLRASELALVERHLTECADCRKLEGDLRRSQAILRDLANADLPEVAIAMTRARIVAAVKSSPRGAWMFPRWAWFALAGAVLVALGLLLNLPLSKRRPSTAPVVAQTEAQPTPAAQQIRESLAPAQSTKAAPATVSRSVRRSRATDIERLSPEDADQLARALVIVWQLRQEKDRSLASTELKREAQTPLTRIATDDPNVVIYWQFDLNGG